MEIITSHGNADFDSFAAMLAACKLHPEAKIVFSGSKETALRAFLQNPYYDFEELRLRDLDQDKVTKLILVDVSHSSRLGPLSELALRPGLEVFIYDHHPSIESDIRARRRYVKAYGAVTTLMLELLRRRKISISRMEATIMAMGIYEDTGFLTYRTTSPEDAKQVAYLLKCGADLALVSNFLKLELSTDQLSLLNELISSSKHHIVNGVPVVISRAERDGFISDAAAVVHKQVDLERYMVYIAVMRMGEKVHVIGRSRHNRVDIGSVVSVLGGGGHATAASAVVSNMTLVQVVEKILSHLSTVIEPTYMARDIMNPNPHTIEPIASIADARAKFIELNINSLPVVENGQIIGLVTRQQLDRASAHKMRGPLREVMNPDINLIAPDSSLEDVEEKLMQGTQRCLLVGNSADSVEGIITRMDLFRRIYVERKDAVERGKIDLQESSRTVDVTEMLNKRMDKRVMISLKLASEVARKRKDEVYLVGGIVRDLILNYPNKDVDLVVTEDGIGFAKELAEKGGGYARPHKRFGTAVVVFPDGFRLDVATVRSESYPFPGALPQIQAGNLRADLYRRDFTINSLAVSLITDEFGRLVDYFGGLQDIRNRKIRVLHGLSFIDDPTRILRAVRFSNRLSFDLTDGTRQLMESAVNLGMLNRVSGKRIHTELTLLYEDPRPLRATEMLSRYGVLEVVNKKVKLDRFTATLIRNIEATLNWYKLTYLPGSPRRVLLFYMALFEKLRSQDRRRLCERLRLTTKMSRILLEYKNNVRSTLRLLHKGKLHVASEVTRLFDQMQLETILFIHAFANNETMKHAVVTYLTKYRSIRPSLRGKDLVKLGLQPSPIFNEILWRLRQALLDGEIRHRNEELELVKREFAGEENNR